MEDAKEAVSKFLHRSGEEQTQVNESINPAITSETVKPHVHEETTQAVQREVHADHYHTTVQPISQTERLEEQHTHNILPTDQKVFHHGDAEQDRARVAADLAQFKDTTVTAPTTHSATTKPTVVGEQYVHHIHETVQPVVHKEVIQPSVVHTTIPIHETHIAPSEHHGLSTLPAKTLDEFHQTGGQLQGVQHHLEQYEGHPRPYNTDLQPIPAPADLDPEAHHGTHDPVATGHPGLGGPGAAPPISEVIAAASAAAGHQRYDSGVGLSEQSVKPGSGYAGGARRDLYDEQAARGPLDASPSVSGFTQAAQPRTGYVSDERRDLYDEQAARGPLGEIPTARGPVGDSGSSSAGTALGGRTEGNTVAGASAAAAAATAATAVASREVPAGFRETAHGYHTNADQETTYGKTFHGYETHPPGQAASTAAATTAAAAASREIPAGFRETAHGYHTNADQGSTYGRTFHGYETHPSGEAASTLAASRAAAEEERTRGIAARSATDAQPSTREAEREATQGTQKSTETSREQQPKRDVQHSSQGQDPSLVIDKKAESKLTGTAVDGSHSAVFGLTPDGHKHDDTSQGPHMTGESAVPEETKAERKEESEMQSKDTGSRAPDSAGVAKQIDDPRVAEKGHDGAAVSTEDNNKPGAGAEKPSLNP